MSLALQYRLHRTDPYPEDPSIQNAKQRCTQQAPEIRNDNARPSSKHTIITFNLDQVESGNLGLILQKYQSGNCIHLSLILLSPSLGERHWP